MALPRYLGTALQFAGRLSESATQNAVKAAHDQFRVSDVGRAVHQLRRLAEKTGSQQQRLGRVFNKAAKQFQRRGASAAAKYAAGEFATKALKRLERKAMDEFFRMLGPAGPLLRRLLGGASPSQMLEKDIHAAATFLRSLGYDVRQAIQVKKRPVLQGTGLQPGQAKPYIPRGKRHIPSKPGQIPEDVEAEEQQISPPERGEKEEPARQVQMVMVRGSSNVFAVGYDESTWDLYVTFLGGSGERRSGEGASYVYHSVPPHIFNSAMSHLSGGGMGKWVWDSLRDPTPSKKENPDGPGKSPFIHQFPYEIMRIGPNGYVPRQATPIGYRPRMVRQGGKVFASVKQGTGWFSGARAGQALRGGDGMSYVNRGAPNRGRPNRGTPNRG
jgi:hypothetical protein